MRPDTEAYLLLLRQRASDNADLTAWLTRKDGSVAEIMDNILAARGDDAGRFIGGARKDKRIFTQMLVTAGVITAENLAALEAQGEEAAYKEITRDKLIPKRMPDALKALGDSSPVAYLKFTLRDMVTPRPYNSAEARRKYVEAAGVVNAIFDTAYTDTGTFMRDLQLRYLYHVAKGDPDAVIVSSSVINEVSRDPYTSAERAYAQQHGFAGHARITPTANTQYYVFLTKKPEAVSYYSRRAETSEQKKNRESIEQPLGSRFYAAVEQGLRYLDKTKWDEDVLASRNILSDDWSWATAIGGASAAAAVPAEERAEPLTREEVIDPPDCARMKAEGENAGAAYFYAWAYKNLVPKKSAGTKTARAAYETALAEFDRLFSDRMNRRTLGNVIYQRRYYALNPAMNVLPAFPVDPKMREALDEYLSQEGMRRTSAEAQKEARLAFLSEEVGAPVAEIFEGAYGIGKRPLYYRVQLSPEDVATLVRDRQHVQEALKATSPALLGLLEGAWDKKTDNTFRKTAFNATWQDVETLCEQIAREIAGKGGRARFVEPERGVVGKRVGPAVPGPHTSDTIQRTTGLYGVEYGDWMNDADRDAVNVSVAEALSDLAHVLGVPLAAVSLGKRLALALGARGSGKFSAHYEPWSKAINMTRTRGSGALAHEWGHALDHWLADSGQSSRVVNGELQAYFGSMLDGTGGMQGVDVTPEERKAVNDALMGVTDILLAGKKEYNEARTNRWEKEHPSPLYYGETRDAYNRWVRDRAVFVSGLKDMEGDNPMLAAAEQAGAYWKRNEEMFARAWESFVLDKLEKDKRYSGYLVRGTKEHPVYPLGEQRERLYGAFTVFLDALRPILRRLATRPNGRGRTRRPRGVVSKPK